MGRVGSFTGPTFNFGLPLSTVKPSDNNITPSQAQSASDAASASIASLYTDLQNALRDANAGKAVLPKTS